MKIRLVVAALVLLSQALGAVESLPPEVQRFIADREACDHFGGEPSEGNTPEQKERRAFVIQSVEIFCAGTDRRLAALRQRYKNNPVVIKALSKYEDKVEL